MIIEIPFTISIHLKQKYGKLLFNKMQFIQLQKKKLKKTNCFFYYNMSMVSSVTKINKYKRKFYSKLALSKTCFALTIYTILKPATNSQKNFRKRQKINCVFFHCKIVFFLYTVKSGKCYLILENIIQQQTKTFNKFFQVNHDSGKHSFP